MPLVTITTAAGWNPEVVALMAQQIERQEFMIGLGEAFPDLLTTDGQEIGVDAGTPPLGVQVCYKTFGRLDINTPDVWILIMFTEDPNGLVSPPADSVEERLEAIREEVCGRIAHWVFGHKPEGEYPLMAIDLFWGPGHGIMVGRDGTKIIDW